MRATLDRFTRDPVGVLQAMNANTPTRDIAVQSLLVATLLMVVLDFAYGPWAYPHSVAEGGKRAAGAWVGAMVEVTRAFGYAAVLWLAGRTLKHRVSAAQAIWMTVPYALALFAFEVLQFGTVAVFHLTDINLYGPLFMIGFGACLLVLVVSVRALFDGLDWLSALPVAGVTFIAGTYMPPLAIALAGLVWLITRDGEQL